MRPTTFCERVGEVEAKAVVTTMHHSLAEVRPKTPGDTRCGD